MGKKILILEFKSLVTCGGCRRPGLEWLENYRAFIRPPAVAMLLHVRGPLVAPLDDFVV